MSKGFSHNIPEVKRKIKKSLKAKDKAINEAIDDFYTRVVFDAKKNVAYNRSIATGELISSISKGKDEAGVAAPYATFVEFGTKGKVRIPADPQLTKIARQAPEGKFEDFLTKIRDWARGKNIRSENVVFLIAQEILKKGSSPHPFWFPAVFKNKHVLERDLYNALKKKR